MSADYWVLYRTSGVTSADGHNDAFSGWPAEGGQQACQDYGRRIYPWGLDSRMPSGGETVAVCVAGNVAGAMILGGRCASAPAPAIEEGETVLYGKSGTKILLDKDGNITLIPGGGAKVKLGDSVSGNLVPVALYTQLKTDFDALVAKYNSHTHQITNVQGGVATITSATTTASGSNLSTSVASSNVVAKK